MITVGSFEAKTRFSELLRKIAEGAEILIANRGKIVAKLTAYKDKGPDPELFIQRMHQLRKGKRCSLVEIQQMKEETRKR